MSLMLNRDFNSALNLNSEVSELQEILSIITDKDISFSKASQIINELGGARQIFGLTKCNKTTHTNLDVEFLQKIKKIKTLIDIILCEKIRKTSLLDNLNGVADYYKSVFVGQAIQQQHVLFMNDKNHMISEHCLQKGTVNQLVTYPRELIKLGLKCNATKFVMIRYQPSSYATAEPADHTLFEQISDIAKRLNMELIDYIIIGESNDHIFLQS